MITAKNLKKHELIGLEAEIITSNNEDLVGLKGKIVERYDLKKTIDFTRKRLDSMPEEIKNLNSKAPSNVRHWTD